MKAGDGVLHTPYVASPDRCRRAQIPVPINAMAPRIEIAIPAATVFDR